MTAATVEQVQRLGNVLVRLRALWGGGWDGVGGTRGARERLRVYEMGLRGGSDILSQRLASIRKNPDF